MSNLVSVESTSHWYYPSGGACHVVPMKSKPGEVRPANVGDARKLGLYPSVTNVIGVLDKPALVAWKQEQAILASLTLPRLNGESEDDFAKRVVADALHQVRHAADRGTQIHAIIEEFLLRGDRMTGNEFYYLCEPTIEWLSQNVMELHYAEKTVVGSGYAGKLDFKAELRGHGLSIVDVKSRKTTNGKFAVYDENGIQLSAYLEADAITCPRAINRVSLLVDSEKAAPPHLHVWPQEDHDRTYACFQNILNVWTYLKKYDPRQA